MVARRDARLAAAAGTASERRRQGGRLPAVCLAGMLAGLSGLAAQGPDYRYGELWWDEYPPDAGTELLLHFGPPLAPATATLVAAAQARQADEQYFDNVLRADAPVGDRDLNPPELQGGASRPPVDMPGLVPGAVADYSDRRRVLRLPAGLATVPHGRFGAGLACDASVGLAVQIAQPQSAECWIRVDRLPRREACILSLGGDEARLLLRPDGRAELRLRKPRGNPDTTRLAPAARQALESRPVEIVSPAPVPTGAWTHLAVVSIPHPAPGNTGSWEAALQVDGSRVASYLSEGGNRYDFFGPRNATLVIGNSQAGDAAFTGLLDELRVSTVHRSFYERPALEWRDAAAARPLQFDRPWFRSDGTVVHASFDRGAALDRSADADAAIGAELHGGDFSGLLVDGIRGRACTVDAAIANVRVPLAGMDSREGALEFWMRPRNWDDCTGYWHHSPPLRKDLTVARVLGRGGQPLFTVTLPRAYNNERQRIPLDPGHWSHIVLVWDATGWAVHIDGKAHAGRRREAGADLTQPLACVEFGMPDDITVMRGARPAMDIDEVVGYRTHLRQDEVVQARRRWMSALEPIPLYEAGFAYKWSLRRLSFSVEPLLPEGVSAAAASVSLHAAPAGAVVAGPIEMPAIQEGAFRCIVSDGQALPYGDYQLRFTLRDAAGSVVASGARDWSYAPEPWRGSTAGMLDRVPAPWTAIRAEGDRIDTRMTSYRLGPDGLPAGITADGVEILAAPFEIREAGRRLPGRIVRSVDGPETEKTWTAAFTGSTCDVRMECRAEYDGMIRYELHLTPKGPLAPLAFVMPVRRDRATHWLAYPVGERGPRTGLIPAADGLALTSRADPATQADWKQYQAQRQKQPGLSWEQYWQPLRQQRERYGFYAHVDLNDRNRGLWWFCDNAAGWAQSRKQGAVEIVRTGEAVALELHLVAEAGATVSGQPVVFGILPHPARPMPDKYRLFNRVSPEVDPVACDVFDAFYPWPMDPRARSMNVYPAPDPARPGNGPSWEYAERCIPIMKACKARGTRTMYLSKAYFSCRAGAYDNWEWRSGEGSTVSLTPSFVNYLCWEMDEWIRRGIWDAIYLDECYEHPALNLEAGLSVRLPDGGEQPGVTNFQFRELMKRWRNIFTAHGRDPLLLAHLTYSWQYQGIVFCDAYLDGENRPIVSLNGGDWIDRTSKTQFEVVQNSRLWGVSAFYMPFIAEGGFEDKTRSLFPRWQWRMARQAQSQFAHYETATVYEGQGSQVYRGYWADLLGWGAGDPAEATFHPYWDNAAWLQVEDQGGTNLVSFYRRPGRVLLIASNRSPDNRTLRITLDGASLGLKPGAKAVSLDRTLVPPAGADHTPAKQAAATAREARDDLLDRAAAVPLDGLSLAASLDLTLDAPEDRAAAEAQSWEPRFEGACLLLPVRGRDYRVVSLE